ncbi:hypothetical protein ABZU75_08090 [Streptosporangium sp. NPDC005286]|uniref:hypothetical protein n=1 Tax=Streptosporangium sp. NPDC005286 TaxID=3154463 RepID=UPI0033BE94B3
MTVWWRGTRIVSAVGAGVLIFGGASGVYAAQPAESAESPLDLAAAPGTWSRWSRTGEVIRFRIRLRGPGTGARLAVVTTPADALRSIECPVATRPATPLPKGTAVCSVGDLPADGGLVDVLLAAPQRPRDITLTAMARMRGPGGETVQQGQGTLKGSDVVTRQVRGTIGGTVEGIVGGTAGGTAGGPDAVTRQIRGAAGSPEPAHAQREVRQTLPVSGAPEISGPSRIYLGDAASAWPADPHAGVETLGGVDLVLNAPQAVGERGWVPKIAPDASEAEKVEQRTLAFLFDVLERPSGPEVPRSVVAGTGGSSTTGMGGSTAVPSTSVAPAAPAAPSAPVAPEGSVQPGTRLPADAAIPGAAPETSGGVAGHGPAVAVPKPVKTPEEHLLQRQNGRNHPVMGSHAGREAAGRKMSGKQRAACRSGARREGAGRPMPGPVGPGYPAGGQTMIGKPGARRPVVAPMGPGYPGAVQWPAGQLIQPGQGMPGRPAKPGQGMLVQPGQGMPGQLGQGMLVQPGQLGAQPQGMGQPMLPGHPGAGGQGKAGRPGAPQREAGGPVGPGYPGTGYPGTGYPGTGFPGAGQQVPMAQPPGGQAPMVPQQVPPLPMGQVPGVPSQVPPASAGMAGPGLGTGPQLQLPPAGSFPAAAQVPVPQGAPLPQDLDGPNTQVQAVAESSPLLTGVRGLPAVGAAVGALLGLLWLQRRIQRRRRSRHVL